MLDDKRIDKLEDKIDNLKLNYVFKHETQIAVLEAQIQILKEQINSKKHKKDKKVNAK